jgi:uncharacterized repeat protein (TIGR01451 family)
MVVASAGNSGNACRTVQNAPGMLDQAFTIGATASDANNTIAGFSSRGPSSLTNKVKPDVVAPGVAVRSSQRSAVNAYGNSNGTSMAAPHVAGVAALLWSAAPWLRGDVSTTEAVLRASAKPLTDPTTCFGTPGSTIPNNTYGHGLIDAQAALEIAWMPITTTTPMTAFIGAPITFTINLGNLSPFPRNGVILTSTLPLSTTLVSVSSPGQLSGNTVSWSIPLLPPNEQTQVSFVVTTSVPSTLVNSSVSLTFEGLQRPIPGKPGTVSVFNYQLNTPLIVR